MEGKPFELDSCILPWYVSEYVYIYRATRKENKHLNTFIMTLYNIMSHAFRKMERNVVLRKWNVPERSKNLSYHLV